MKVSFSKEEKRILIPLIQQYFLDHRDEEIGILASELCLDFIASDIGPFIYNNALKDARKALEESTSELDYRLYELEKPLPKRQNR